MQCDWLRAQTRGWVNRKFKVVPIWRWNIIAKFINDRRGEGDGGGGGEGDGGTLWRDARVLFDGDVTHPNQFKPLPRVLTQI